MLMDVHYLEISGQVDLAHDNHHHATMIKGRLLRQILFQLIISKHDVL